MNKYLPFDFSHSLIQNSSDNGSFFSTVQSLGDDQAGLFLFRGIVSLRTKGKNRLACPALFKG